MTHTLDFNQRVTLDVALMRQIRELASMRNTWMVGSRVGIRADLRSTIRLLRLVRKSHKVEFSSYF